MTVKTCQFYKMKVFQTFYSPKNPEKMYHGFHKNIEQQNCFQHIIIRRNRVPNQNDF